MKRFTKFALVFVAIVATFLAVSVYAASVTQTASAVNTQLSPSDWKDKIIAAVSALTKTDVPAIITSLNSLDSDAVTNVTITAAAPVTNMTGLVAFLTNAVLTLQYGDVVYGDVTNSLLTNVTITVQAGAVPAVQAGAAPSLTIQR